MSRPIQLGNSEFVVTAWCETLHGKKSATFPLRVLIRDALTGELRMLTLESGDQNAMLLSIGAFSEFTHRRMKSAVLSLCEVEGEAEPFSVEDLSPSS